MENNFRRGTINRNQGSPAQAGTHAGASSGGMGHSLADVAPLGARRPHTAWPRSGQAQGNHRRGGQASGPGLFGLPLLKRAERAAVFQAEDKAPARHTLTIRPSGSQQQPTVPVVTPAMRRAADAAEAREDRDWRERANMLEDGHVHPALLDINLYLEGE